MALPQAMYTAVRCPAGYKQDDADFTSTYHQDRSGKASQVFACLMYWANNPIAAKARLNKS